MRMNFFFMVAVVAVTNLFATQLCAQYWRVDGNADASSSSKLGTTKSIPLRFFTNNLERMRIEPAGKVGIGTTAPNASALLEVSSTTKGVLFPRMTQAQRNAIHYPVNGLLIFQTDGVKGFYYYYSSAWHPLTPSSADFANPSLSNLTSPTAINADLLPDAAGARSLGSSSLGWKSVYLTGPVYLDGRQFLTGDTLTSNTGLGFGSLSKHGYGNTNCAFGSYSLYNNTTGYSNTAMGSWSMEDNTEGGDNTAMGKYALQSNEIGNANTALGFSAGMFTYNPNYCTFIGAYAGGSSDLSNSTAIGRYTAVYASNQVRIGDDEITSIGGNVDWTTFSDGRFKKNLKENVPGLDFINGLRPITYNLDVDALEATRKSAGFRMGTPTQKEITSRQAKGKIVYTGFVAQEVETLAMKIGYDFSGVDAPKNAKDFYGIRYAEFVVPLVKAVQELSKKTDEIDELKKKNAELEDRLKKLEDLFNKSITGSNLSVELSGASLDQNMPNPFGATTIIGYHIPDNAGIAKIIITDMKGSMIKNIVLSAKGKGQLTLGSGSLSAGEYIYSLWVDGKQADIKRMIITK